MEALQLLNDMKSITAMPVDMVTRSRLYDDWLQRENHQTGPAIVRILVDYESRMSVILKGMNKLLGYLDPDQPLNLADFPSIPTDLRFESPLKGIPSRRASIRTSSGLPPQSDPEGSKDVATPASAAQSSSSEGGVTGRRALLLPSFAASHLTNPDPPTKVPDVPAPVPDPKEPKLELLVPILPPPGRVMAGKFKVPGLNVRGSLDDWLGGIANPARTNPEQFEHMQQPSPKRDHTRIDLSESPPGGTETGASNEEDYTLEDDEEDASPPPIKQRPHTRSASKPTPPKSLRASGSQGGSSSKKTRRGR